MADGLRVTIEKRLGGFKLGMTFTAEREILVLFGPSGAGKSQTLNAIAGLSPPDSGFIELDGRVFYRGSTGGVAVNLPARQRRVGYVFQQYALFPHLTALENVGFSFWRDRHARPRAAQWLERMRLESLADRYPHELSGGQQQRIAIARALAAEPQVLLLDEPFSALDYPLRQQLHEELLRLQDEAPLIVVYVTHNLEEALAMGQRLAVMRNGRIAQIGSTAEVVTNPGSRAIGEILGLPNILEGRVTRLVTGGFELDWNGLQLRTESRQMPIGSRVSAHLIPDAIEVGQAGTTSETVNELSGVVKRRQIATRNAQLRVLLENGAEIEVALPMVAAGDPAMRPGEPIALRIPPNCVKVLAGDDAET